MEWVAFICVSELKFQPKEGNKLTMMILKIIISNDSHDLDVLYVGNTQRIIS